MKLFWFHAHVFLLILALRETHANGLRPRVTDPASAIAKGAPSISQIAATTEEKRAAAKAVVEKYWSTEPRGRYLLLADSYKSNLRRLGITNGAKYAAETQPPERIWGTRTYQRVDVSRDARQSRDIAQIVLLIDWEQEGYRGVMTYIFDLTTEANQWRIGNIVH